VLQLTWHEVVWPDPWCKSSSDLKTSRDKAGQAVSEPKKKKNIKEGKQLVGLTRE
jgi:hypothetical protein